MRILVGLSGSSGIIYGVKFLQRCPGDKYLVVSKWGAQVLEHELGLGVDDLRAYAKAVFADDDLSAPFASGSNRYDALVLLPCSISTLGKIANGIADTLITRAAQVALKERIRLVVGIRETPLSTQMLENAWRLSRDGAIVMPVSPPWYRIPRSMDDVVSGFVDKVLPLIGVPVEGGWRSDEL
ncbi:MAG TPA: UbiX family flavin prenyltransferase [Vicinamibacteria bacterium]|nr:UbiX family flavin prenyltransferase [Vicinamibacteria bacterium]